MRASRSRNSLRRSGRLLLRLPADTAAVVGPRSALNRITIDEGANIIMIGSRSTRSHHRAECDLIKMDVERHGKWVDPAPCKKVWYTLFVKDLAVAQGGVQSAPLVDMHGVSIGNRFGYTFLHFAFFMRTDAKWHHIS